MNAPPFAIRHLGAADVDEYRRIRLASLATDPDAFGATYAEQVAQPITEFANRLSSATVVGAYTGQTIVGVAHLTYAKGRKQAHKGTIQGFFVEPHWRHRGIGAALMTAVIDLARDKVEQLHLTVVQTNASAIALYQRFGFVTYGVEPRALKSERGYVYELLMSLLL